MKKTIIVLLSLLMLFSLCACAAQNAEEAQSVISAEVTVTDMIGREVTVIPGTYSRVVWRRCLENVFLHRRCGPPGRC